MAKKTRIMPPIHPGETLREDFLKPLGLSANRLAMGLQVPVTRVNDIVPRQACHYRGHLSPAGAILWDHAPVLDESSGELRA